MNLIFASAQIARRGGLLIEYILRIKILRTLEKTRNSILAIKTGPMVAKECLMDAHKHKPIS